jgi:hypothetical protein
MHAFDNAAPDDLDKSWIGHDDPLTVNSNLVIEGLEQHAAKTLIDIGKTAGLRLTATTPLQASQPTGSRHRPKACGH